MFDWSGKNSDESVKSQGKVREFWYLVWVATLNGETRWANPPPQKKKYFFKTVIILNYHVKFQVDITKIKEKVSAHMCLALKLNVWPIQSSSFYKVILNILVFRNKMQRVPHVKEIDKNFQAFISLPFFLKLIYLIKALLLYISGKNTLIAFIWYLIWIHRAITAWD